MIFEEKTITLKDGRSAVLKTPELSDAAQMLAYIKKACGETDFLLRYPEEYEGMTIEKEEQWVQNLRSSPYTLAITAYVDGTVVGNCEINFKGGIKTGHRAVLAIAILKDYWNLGIGTAFFKELMAAAEANPACELVELEFVEGNGRAKALYEKFGFRMVSERPKAFKLKDGSYRSEFYMQKVL